MKSDEEVKNEEVKKEEVIVVEDVYKIKENIITKNGNFFTDISNGNLKLLKNIKQIEMDPGTTAINVGKFSEGQFILGDLTSKIKMTKGCVMMKI